MEVMENQPCIFLGIKIKPGPIERYKIDNFTLDSTVNMLKSEAEKKANVPSASLELIHHGKILKDNNTLQDSGVKNGEMVHVVKKKEAPPAAPPPTFSDAELQQLNASLRTLGCTPNAPGWTRAMQLLNDESAMAEIMEQSPSLRDECVTLSILHEVELLAALGATAGTMRRGADAHPGLVAALRHLMRLVRASSPPPPAAAADADAAPTSGFAYSLEALSEDEDAEEEGAEGAEGEGAARAVITQDQLAAALQAATEAVLSPRRSAARLLRQADLPAPAPPAPAAAPGASRAIITAEMFSEAIADAISQTAAAAAAGASSSAPTPMDQSTTPSSSSASAAAVAAADAGAGATAGAGAGEAAGGAPGAGGRRGRFAAQLHHMHELGLLDDALNMRALLICSGDVNAAINLVFSAIIGDD